MASKNNRNKPNLLFSYINPMVLRGSRLTTKMGFSSVVSGKCCASLPGSRTKRRPSYISSWFEEIILVCLYTSSWNTVALGKKNPEGQHNQGKIRGKFYSFLMRATTFISQWYFQIMTSPQKCCSVHMATINSIKLKTSHNVYTAINPKYFYVWTPILDMCNTQQSFFFFCPCLWHAEGSRPGIKPAPQQWPEP